MKEIREVSGFYGYFCDRLGNVFSNKAGELRPMKPRVGSRGYLIIGLSVSKGRCKHVLVHRIIASTWIGSPAVKMEVNHKNGIKTDNRLENLEWASRIDNERHARRVLGKKLYGSYHPCSKISEDQALEIRRLRSEGWTHKRLSERYGIGMSQINRIVRRIKWSHVRNPDNSQTA